MIGPFGYSKSVSAYGRLLSQASVFPGTGEVRVAVKVTSQRCLCHRAQLKLFSSTEESCSFE